MPRPPRAPRVQVWSLKKITWSHQSLLVKKYVPTSSEDLPRCHQSAKKREPPNSASSESVKRRPELGTSENCRAVATRDRQKLTLRTVHRHTCFAKKQDIRQRRSHTPPAPQPMANRRRTWHHWRLILSTTRLHPVPQEAAKTESCRDQTTLLLCTALARKELYEAVM